MSNLPTRAQVRAREQNFKIRQLLAIYEVLRIQRDPKKPPHIFFQRDKDHQGIYDPHSPGSTHITVPSGAVNLVKKFIIERNTR